MPKKKFGQSFAKSGDKKWKETKSAKQGGRGGRFDKYDAGSYIGATTINIGVYSAGPRKDQDYVSFETTFTEGEHEGDTVETAVAFGGDRETAEQRDQKHAKVVKYCKALFPDLEDEIEECADLNAFAELIESEMAGTTVEHEFEIIETTIDGQDIKYLAFGDVLGEEETEEEEEKPARPSRSKPAKQEAEDEEDEEDEEEADDDDEEEEEDEEEDEEEFTPVVGSYVSFKPKGKKIAIECDVKTVNKRTKTCTLEDENGKKYVKVPWDKVSSVE